MTVTAITKEAELRADKLCINLDMLRFLDGFFREKIESGKHDFISFRVLRSGVLIFNGNYGVRSPGGPPLSEDDIFPVASVTKPVVATLCAILQEEGEIDFWDKVQRWFPDFEGEHKDEVQLWQLLCHVSGMDDSLYDFRNKYIENELGIKMPDYDAPDEAYISTAMQVRDKLNMPKLEASITTADETFFSVMLKAPLATKPSTEFSYCGMGYEMMKMIIERVTGESLDAYARRRLFEPLGMVDSHWILPESKWSRFVKRGPSYRGADWLNDDSCFTNTSPTGGLKTTMPDLAAFGQMYLQNGTFSGKRIISPASVRLMTTDHNHGLPDSFWMGRWLGANWGLGWNVRNGKKDDLGFLRSNNSYDHGGFGGARLMVDPDHELVVATYMDEHDDIPYPNHSRAFNILYAALD